MSGRYPKSREELEAENRALSIRVVALESDAASLRAALSRSEIEKAYLMRRRQAHLLSPDAADSFRRPFRGSR